VRAFPNFESPVHTRFAVEEKVADKVLGVSFGSMNLSGRAKGQGQFSDTDNETSTIWEESKVSCHPSRPLFCSISRVILLIAALVLQMSQWMSSSSPQVFSLPFSPPPSAYCSLRNRGDRLPLTYPSSVFSEIDSPLVCTPVPPPASQDCSLGNRGDLLPSTFPSSVLGEVDNLPLASLVIYDSPTLGNHGDRLPSTFPSGVLGEVDNLPLSSLAIDDSPTSVILWEDVTLDEIDNLQGFAQPLIDSPTAVFDLAGLTGIARRLSLGRSPFSSGGRSATLGQSIDSHSRFAFGASDDVCGLPPFSLNRSLSSAEVTFPDMLSALCEVESPGGFAIGQLARPSPTSVLGGIESPVVSITSFVGSSPNNAPTIFEEAPSPHDFTGDTSCRPGSPLGPIRASSAEATIDPDLGPPLKTTISQAAQGLRSVSSRSNCIPMKQPLPTKFQGQVQSLIPINFVLLSILRLNLFVFIFL
jgi:hypothetical protein